MVGFLLWSSFVLVVSFCLALCCLLVASFVGFSLKEFECCRLAFPLLFFVLFFVVCFVLSVLFCFVSFCSVLFVCLFSLLPLFVVFV